ncbi:MAG: HEAT repeat domain-containing protein [Anaerolineales bacterium]|nr:HEAT repeat domain-containing protein [Anaerolineales bacterium]
MVRRKRAVVNFQDALTHLQDERTLLPSALSALSGADKGQAAGFARVWNRLPVERRRRTAQELVDLAEQNVELDFNALFRHLLDDADARVRAHAIEGLWEDEDAALVKPFAEFLRDDPDAGVRAAATDALGRFLLLAEYGRLANTPAETLGETLLATARDLGEDLAVRCHAVEALGYWSDDVVREVIAAAFDDAAPELRASAVAAMGHSADKYWRETAANELQSPDARMRFHAARATGELENRDATEALIELLDDPDREVQSAAITALGQVGGKLAKRALTDAAASDDEMLSELADEALQELEFGDNSEFLLFDLATDEK